MSRRKTVTWETAREIRRADAGRENEPELGIELLSEAGREENGPELAMELFQAECGLKELDL